MGSSCMHFALMMLLCQEAAQPCSSATPGPQLLMPQLKVGLVKDVTSG